MSRKVALWALALVLSVLGASWIWSRYSGGLARAGELASTIPGATWPLVLASAAAFYLFDWLRFYSLLRVFDFKLSPWAGFRMSFVSDFVCGLTPVTELNLPTMVYFLGREGVAPGPAAAVVLAKSLSMTLWVCATALVTLACGDARLPPSALELLPVSLACVAALTAGVAAMALWPGRVLRWTDRRLAKARPGILRRTLEGVRDTASALALIAGARGRWPWLTHAAAWGSVAAYVLCGRALAAGMGLAVTPGRAAAAFSASLMVAYLAPVPGSIGVTEWATSYLLDPAMTQEAMTVAILLRALTCYAAVPVGAAIVFAEAWRRGTPALLAALGRDGGK